MRRLLAISLLAFNASLSAQVVPDAAPAPRIAYQGRLLEAALPVTGMRNFTFAIRDTTDTELWNSGVQAVSVNKGLYAVVLGGVGMPEIPPSLLSRAYLSLRLSIDGTVLAPDVDLVAALQSRGAWEVMGPFAGDVTGTQNALRVSGLQGIPLDLPAAPATGQVLAFNGTSWMAGNPVGAQGPQGDPGPQGAQGETGPQGPIGITGATGATGAVGPTGASGGRTLLSGVVDPLPGDGSAGDFWLNTVASTLFGPKDAATGWPGSGTLLIGPQGPQGVQGPLGPIGLTGAMGPIGLQGIQGEKGDKGDTGATGASGGRTLLAGIVDPLPADGSEGDFWLNTATSTIFGPKTATAWPATGTLLVGPQGLKGDTGDQGPMGDTGPIGLTGPIGPIGPVGPTGSVGGTGAAGQVGFWSDPTTLSGNSNLFWDNTNRHLGINQASPRASLEVGGTDGLLVTGTANSGTVRALGAGVRMQWYPRKGAFRVGMAETNYWDDDGTTYPRLALYSIGMGYQPRATGVASTAIGAYNHSTGDYTLSLGSYSQATASHAIAIGTQVYASGIYSIALGSGANTNGKDGAMVVGDDCYFQTAYASNDNQLTMRFSGGYSDDDPGAPDYVAGQRKAYRFWTSYPDNAAGVYMNHGDNSWRSYCSRDLKENFAPVDGEWVLGRIRQMPITRWNYKTEDPSVTFIGPVAEDFWDAFQLAGTDNKGINSFALEGVTLAGVKALEARTNDLQQQIETLKAESQALKARLDRLEALLVQP